MNSVNLIGRLTADPDFRSAKTKGKDDLSICSFTLAVDRIGEGADFIRCTAFGAAADFVDQYFTKGLRVGVSGRIQTGSYQDKDGNTRYTTDVIIEHTDFADGKKDDGGSTGNRRGRR